MTLATPTRRLSSLFTAIDTASETIYERRASRLWWGVRPDASTRRTYRKRATGAGLKYLDRCAAEDIEPTQSGLNAAVVSEFSGTTLTEVKGVWLSLLLPIVVRLIWDWWINREPAGQSGVS